jgi:hypothetical protein
MKIAATALMIFLFAPLGNVYGQAPAQPTLPQNTVGLTLPTQGTSACPTLTTGSSCIRKIPSGDATSLQNAINASTCGDTIVLVAGSTYSGNFTVPATSCSGWTEIVSSAVSSLPTPGNRVSLSNASNMAIVSTPNTAAAIQFKPSSNHWRLIGIDITTSYVSTTNTVYYLVGMGESQSNQSLLPSYVIFDRCLILGLSNTNTQHGIGMDGASVGIVDSYCDEIHHNGSDAQCFFAYNGPGPFLIQNNFIQASTENIMFGGADPAIANLVPSDITIVGNLIQKNTAWRGLASPYNWQVKNLLEFKNAQRVLIDGNVLQYDWEAQQGTAVLIAGANQSGACTWCIAQDITFTHNLLQHIPSAIEIAFYNGGSGFVAQVTQRVLVRNNLILDSNSSTWGAGDLFFAATSSAAQGHDWIIDHNTGFSDHKFLNMGDSGTVANFQLTNNIGAHGTYGIGGTGQGEGSAALNFYAPGAVYGDILLQTPTGANPGGYPATTSFNTLSSTGFTSVTGTSPNLSGNFQLLNTSPFHQAGTDGKDVGVWDWTCLNNDSAAALAGIFVPSSSGCALSGNLPLQPPSNLTVVVQ